MAKALVTGGAGFIGSHVVDHLLAMGMEVVVLDDLSGGFEKNVASKAIFVKGSILDVLLIEKLFQKYTFDYVYHLAAYAAEGLSHFIRKFNYENNVLGSINLINASVKYEVNCFVFTSSIAVYGDQPSPMEEMLMPRPEDPYGIAKYTVEMDLKTAYTQFGLKSIIFRPHNVYGERQHIGDSYRNVIGIFMNQIMQKKPLTIYGDGSQSRAFSYIDDVAPYIAQSVENLMAYNQVFNIGGDEVCSVKTLAQYCMEAMGETVSIQYLPPRNEVSHAFANHLKWLQFFKISQAPTTLKEGLKRMADWAKVNGVMENQPFENIELIKNIPQNWLS